MARYLSTEELFECRSCGIEASRREFYDSCHALKCPNCHHSSFHKQTGCELVDGADLPAARGGILLIKYMGFGFLDCPEISIEQELWEPDHCDHCYTTEMIKRTKVYDVLDTLGFKKPHKMAGVDVVSGGEQIVVPYFNVTNVFINEEPVEITSCGTDQWEYYL